MFPLQNPSPEVLEFWRKRHPEFFELAVLWWWRNVCDQNISKTAATMGVHLSMFNRWLRDTPRLREAIRGQGTTHGEKSGAQPAGKRRTRVAAAKSHAAR